jgi:phosphatidylserine decarboxylase
MSDISARLFVLLQKVLPKYLLTSIVFWLARRRASWLKNFLIRQFVNAYDVDVDEVLLPVPEGFESFNAFFIRELAEDARVIENDNDVIVSPADGTVSAAGMIEKDQLFQAKGIRYSLADLMATDTAEANAYIDGAFATIYLAPYNYHRVHAPVDGELITARYVPGDLFSVNAATVAKLPNLFVRNERLICQIKTSTGPMAIIFVGAMNVGSISTQWTGEIRPRKSGVVEQIEVPAEESARQFSKGDGIGWFNMGSTVILLRPPASTNNFEDISVGQSLRMGQAIGRITGTQ